MFAAFKSSEIGVAAGFALLVEGVIVALLIFADASKSLTPDMEAELKEVPIAVQPVLDDLPLLKQGSKTKPKLPEMWRKPKPRPRYEDKTAASTKAEKTLEKPVEKELQKANKEVPPDDKAELAKKVEEQLEEEPDEKEAPKFNEEGAEDGDKQGTEVDPLKAFVLDQYRKRLIAWFQAGFSPTSDACDARLGVSAQIGGDGTVSSFAVSGSSGNAGFDTRVKSHMQGKVGNQIPPPPPNYSGAVTHLSLRFSGEKACGSGGKAKAPSGGGSDPSPEQPDNEEPAEKPAPVETPEPEEAPAPSPEGE